MVSRALWMPKAAPVLWLKVLLSAMIASLGDVRSPLPIRSVNFRTRVDSQFGNKAINGLEKFDRA